MAAALGTIATVLTGGITELNRRGLEAGLNEASKPQREDAKKLRDEQEALAAKQKQELADIEKEGELKQAAVKDREMKLSAQKQAGKGGREGTLVGVLGSSASSGPAPVKTLLGS
jgi:hypothetical protein